MSFEELLDFATIACVEFDASCLLSLKCHCRRIFRRRRRKYLRQYRLPTVADTATMTSGRRLIRHRHEKNRHGMLQMTTATSQVPPLAAAYLWRLRARDIKRASTPATIGRPRHAFFARR